MRICFISDANDMNTRRLMGYVAKMGHEVHFMLPIPITTEIEGISCHYLSPGINIRKVRFVFRFLKLRQLLSIIQPNILHAYYVGGESYLGALSGFHPFVISTREGDILADQGAFDSLINKVLKPYALRQADLVTAHSRQVLNIVNKYKRPDALSGIIRIGVDLGIFKPDMDASRLRRSLNIDKSSPVVLSPRMFQSLYNIDTIINAIPSVLDRVPDTIFVLITFGALSNPIYRHDIEARVKALGVSDSVRFIGEVRHSEMALFYNLADLVVSVPSSDGMPNSVQESMACGTPVIVTDLPSLREIVVQGENGLLVPIRDRLALANAIVNLLLDFEQRQKFIARNLELARTELDSQLFMARLDALYRRLVA